MKTKLLAFFIFTCFALTAKSQILKLGVNMANVSITNDGDIDEAKMLTSFHAGFLLNLRFIPFLTFQPGILFTERVQNPTGRDNRCYLLPGNIKSLLCGNTC